ncbi:MAG: dTDP-4-dehydrorhamnose reductase [Desulfobacterales bacterium]|nr:dTDP-4-dehydrorhamnose reductase [Desulfobacterales bacterium]
MKILVTGANGQLGKELSSRHISEGFEIIDLDRSHLDITNKYQVQRQISSYSPDIVVNTAAYTKVDLAETDQDQAFLINREGPENLAVICHLQDIPLIHISTDYVFDGTDTTPYKETAPVCPVSIYGKSKAAGEQKIQNILDKHVIIRTSWLYSATGQNFVNTMIRMGREKDTLNVVADQFGSPTSVTDLAEAILKIAVFINGKSLVPWGIYHYTSTGVTTWHEFAETIFYFSRHYDDRINVIARPVLTKEYPTPAVRPKYSVLDCSLVSKNFGIILKPWQESLKSIIDQIFNHN